MPIFFKNTFEFRMEKHAILFAFCQNIPDGQSPLPGYHMGFWLLKIHLPLEDGNKNMEVSPTWSHEFFGFWLCFLAFSAAILVFFKSPRMVLCQIPRCAGLLKHQQYQKQLFRWTLFSFKQLWTPTLRFFYYWPLYFWILCGPQNDISIALQTWKLPRKETNIISTTKNAGLLSMKSRWSNDGILMSRFMKSQYNWVTFHPLYTLNNHLDLLKMLGKRKTSSPKWWFNAGLPW